MINHMSNNNQGVPVIEVVFTPIFFITIIPCIRVSASSWLLVVSPSPHAKVYSRFPLGSRMPPPQSPTTPTIAHVSCKPIFVMVIGVECEP
jgi:hypothetical protein